MTTLTRPLSPAFYAPAVVEPVRRPVASPRTTEAEPLVDERLFGAEMAHALRSEDREALTTVSWILVAIVTGGCLLMLGSVAVVLM